MSTVPHAAPTAIAAVGALCAALVVHGIASRHAARPHQPRRQALAWLLLLPATWLHENGHALASILLTGRGRIRLHARGAGATRADGLVCLGSSDTLYYGPRTDAIVSAAPLLLWWPAALVVLAQAGGVPTPLHGALAGTMLWSGLLSRTDRLHLRRALRDWNARQPRPDVQPR